MKSVASNVLTILIVAGVVFTVALGIAQQQVSANGPAQEAVRVTVERGSNWTEVAGTLKEKGAISSGLLFRLAARYSGKARDLKFGEYEIAPGASMEEIIALMATGGNVLYQVTVPEGMTVAMAVDRLMANEDLTGEITELPPEGSLLPETYNFEPGAERSAIIARMQAAMDEALDEAWAARDPDLPLKSKEELLILASIVEKETRPQEHGKVASVFVNRLRRGMKLQTDPTVIYGITAGKAPLGRGLRRSELRAPTPYNTYVIPRLPPTPIANPGRQSLMAVAQPAETDYLFFVADGTGGHTFSTNLDDHNKAVARWREIERQRKRDEAGAAEREAAAEQ